MNGFPGPKTLFRTLVCVSGIFSRSVITSHVRSSAGAGGQAGHSHSSAAPLSSVAGPEGVGMDGILATRRRPFNWAGHCLLDMQAGSDDAQAWRQLPFHAGADSRPNTRSEIPARLAATITFQLGGCPITAAKGKN